MSPREIVYDVLLVKGQIDILSGPLFHEENIHAHCLKTARFPGTTDAYDFWHTPEHGVFEDNRKLRESMRSLNKSTLYNGVGLRCNSRLCNPAKWL